MLPLVSGAAQTRDYSVKGTVHRILHFSVPVAVSVDLMVSKIGPIASLLLLIHHFGPFRETIKPIVAVAGIEET